MILALIELLWAAMILLFLAGAVAYAFDPHVGVALLKRSLVLLVVLLVGPSLIATVFGQIPSIMWIVAGAGASIAAHWYLTHHSAKRSSHGSGSGASHAERQPHLPHEQDEE